MSVREPTLVPSGTAADEAAAPSPPDMPEFGGYEDIIGANVTPDDITNYREPRIPSFTRSTRNGPSLFVDHANEDISSGSASVVTARRHTCELGITHCFGATRASVIKARARRASAC